MTDACQPLKQLEGGSGQVTALGTSQPIVNIPAKQAIIAKIPSLYSGAWFERKNCGPMMFPTAYATATETDENAFFVVPAVFEVTSDKHITHGASVVSDLTFESGDTRRKGKRMHSL
jgi:hypothetical protein